MTGIKKEAVAVFDTESRFLKRSIASSICTRSDFVQAALPVARRATTHGPIR
jgi:hypothetical protein